MARRSSTRFIARVIPGAKPATYPGFVVPELATLRATVPPGSGWIHEIKFDGYRVQAHNHAHAMALHFLYYNFVRQHATLRVSPAMAAGVTNRLWEMKDVVAVLEAWETMEGRRALDA